MTFPFEELLQSVPEVGMALAVLLGFGFGFALERAGFGRATKLAAQFYLTDMTVFKVMFGAIVTAMLGLMIASAVGAVDLHALSTSAASQTFLWPMAIGGFLLGVGFIVAGYCPGTSMVAAASGNLDGMATVGGVIVGSVLYGWVFPLLGAFPDSGAQGHLFLHELLGIPAAYVAVGIAAIAMVLFLGAEKVETIFSRRAEEGRATHMLAPDTARSHGRAFSAFAAAAVVGMATTLVVPVSTDADVRTAERISVEKLAERVLQAPWGVRVLDLRDRDACAEQRIPGSECVPAGELGEVGLAYSPGTRDLVLVGGAAMDRAPSAALAFPGRLYVLDGGFPAWKWYALTAPEPPSADATAEERAAYRLRAGLNKALTGKAPPPPPPVKGFVAPKKKKGGGCQ